MGAHPLCTWRVLMHVQNLSYSPSVLGCKYGLSNIIRFIRIILIIRITPAAFANGRFVSRYHFSISVSHTLARLAQMPGGIM